ncbi:AraC family transcriptional regulator [Paenibacillus polymyxa]|uniref:Transcriptional regulator n=1 Tax=Paenibacillus polymyxa (strain SC2) TaxID=886882 RepID=E3EJL1_PAEPS|nr:AraC family transcriptional regulator [Paenibacillus polymyxa]ADO56561.1 transcriptional regulator [Paenibacillus polymyxa SC2]WPQ59207.1 AraC family transcriptional regulator [Paenibacillus polymyxa]CCC85270.1 HTH-type transcriptional activator rhaR L-rhamnose operon transcriptional activator rhaR [Paenibacillus polymyxa M1]
MIADVSHMHPLFSIEYVVHDADHNMTNFHYHDAYELYFLEKGYHQILIQDSIYDIELHDVALFKPNLFHRSYQNQGCARTCVYFTERFLRLYFTERAIKSLLGCFDTEIIISLNQEVVAKVKRLLKSLEKENVSGESDRIFILLAELLSLLNNNKDSQTVEQQSSKYANFGPILSYINQNYNKITKIEDIAKSFYMSKYYLCHRFKEVTGLTVIQYLNNIKIQHACNLLINTKLTILEIGNECGFNSSMYFCKIFKQTIFMTPSEFRKKAR